MPCRSGNGGDTSRNSSVPVPLNSMPRDERVSCKRRGFCPSCGARRMAHTAAHLVDRVIAHVRVRQWVLSLPIPLRVLLAAQPQWPTPILHVEHRVFTAICSARPG